MQIDARQLEDDAALEADVCIIGAGVAGVCLALELERSGMETLLLEGGGIDFEADTQELYAGTCNAPIHPRYLIGSRIRQLGGTSNTWLGFCRPLDDQDYRQRHWIPNSGWPFSAEELAGHFGRASALIGIPGSFPEDRPVREDEPELLATTFERHPIRFGDTYREQLDEAIHTKLVLHANAVHLGLAANGKAVEQLQTSTLEGKTARVRARRFVLAAGGLENPRLLLQSDDIQSGGIGNQHDLVGRYFMEHWVFPVAGICVLHQQGPFVDELEPGREYTYYRLDPNAQERERLLNCLFGYSVVPAIGEPRDELVRAPPIPELERFLDGRVLPPARTESRLGFVRFNVRPETPPDPESRVTLGREVDRLGMRRIHLATRPHPSVLETVARSVERLAGLLARRRLGRVWLDPEANAWPVSAGYHHMGATRMHPDPSQGVVDSDCRVHGISNLFVAGSSVFPACGYVNPTFTIVALAVRLAKQLASELERS